MAIQHLVGQFDVRRIAIKDQTIGYEVGFPAGQTNFVAIECVPAVLDNDVGMGFKDRDNFFRSRDRFPMDHPAGRLVYDVSP